MPGGQYTNLKEQAASMGVAHRWPEIARTYAEVNQLFGDIVKVTPSSKVVGDMALFLFTPRHQARRRGESRARAQGFPESVIDMMSGGLGWPAGGWPKEVQRVVLGEKRAAEARRKFKKDVVPGAVATPVNLNRIRHGPLRNAQARGHGRRALFAPDVSAGVRRFREARPRVQRRQRAADAGVLLRLFQREEISVEIEEGKTLIIRLVNVSDPDKDGRRTVTFELNGMTREAAIVDRSVAPQAKARPKADLTNAVAGGAPIPGLISAISVTVGTKVAKGDKLLMMEAMKMQTTVYAAADGVVDTINVQLGDTVESKDLLVQLQAV